MLVLKTNMTPEEKIFQLETLLRLLLVKVNLVTAEYRENKTVGVLYKDSVADLCDRQIYIEEKLKGLTHDGCE